MSKASKRIPRRFLATTVVSRVIHHPKESVNQHSTQTMEMLEVTSKTAGYISRALGFERYELNFCKDDKFRYVMFLNPCKGDFGEMGYKVIDGGLIGKDDLGRIITHQGQFSRLATTYREVPRHVK